MISDAKKLFRDIVTKQFFSCRKIFFLAVRTFFLLQEKNLVPRKKSWGKKVFCHFIMRNFLGVRKKFLGQLSPKIRAYGSRFLRWVNTASITKAST